MYARFRKLSPKLPHFFCSGYAIVRMLISCFLLVSFFILSTKINNGCGRRKARSGYLPRLGRSRKACRSPARVENRLLLRICANDDVTTNSCFKLVSKSSDFPMEFTWPPSFCLWSWLGLYVGSYTGGQHRACSWRSNQAGQVPNGEVERQATLTEPVVRSI